MTIRFGLLGAGRIGKVHAKAVSGNPAARLVAVSDAMPAAAKAIADQYGCEVRTIDAIAAAKDIDAVVICTPTDTHADLIEMFVRAGKAVFCEKPMDLSLARVKQCLEVVRAAKGTLRVGFNRRFDQHFGDLKERIDAGVVGNVELVTILSRDPGAPPVSYIERSGGLFRDMMIHDLDMARFLLGEDWAYPPATVVAVAAGLALFSVSAFRARGDDERGRWATVGLAALSMGAFLCIPETGLLRLAPGPLCVVALAAVLATKDKNEVHQ